MISIYEQTYEKTISAYVNSGLSDTIKIFAQQMNKIISQTDLSNSLRLILHSIDSFYKNVDSPQLDQLRSIDFSSLHKITDIAMETLKDSSVNDDQVPEHIEFTNSEVYESLEEQMSHPKKFQERAYEWTEEKKREWFVLWKVIAIICSLFVMPCLQKFVGDPVVSYVVSKVKNSPKKDAEIIGIMNAGDHAIIIANINYYYKISFTDDDGEQQEGYVAKRNLQKVNVETDNATYNVNFQ